MNTILMHLRRSYAVKCYCPCFPSSSKGLKREVGYTSHCCGVEKPPTDSDTVWNAKASASIAYFWHLSPHIGPFTITFDNEERHCLVFRRFCKIVKSYCWLVHVCVCVRGTSWLQRIFIKFVIWVFHENLF